MVLVDANSYVYRLGTFPLGRVGSLHSNQTVSRLCETKDLHRFQRPKIQNYEAAAHGRGREWGSKIEHENVRRKGNRPYKPHPSLRLRNASDADHIHCPVLAPLVWAGVGGYCDGSDILRNKRASSDELGGIAPPASTW